MSSVRLTPGLLPGSPSRQVCYSSLAQQFKARSPVRRGLTSPQASFQRGPLRFFSSSIRGIRPDNEDAEVVVELQGYQAAAVFDGHGGQGASRTAKQRFQHALGERLRQAQAGKLVEEPVYASPKPTSPRKGTSYKQLVIGELPQSLGPPSSRISLLPTPKSRLGSGQNQTQNIVETILEQSDEMQLVLKYVCKDLDDMINANPQLYETGTTAAVILYDKVLERLTVANVGDSKVMLGFLESFFATVDHKPGRFSEHQRLQANPKSQVVQTMGILRVNGNLSVSRALGDSYMRPYGIIPEPELFQFQLSGVEGQSSGFPQAVCKDPDLRSYHVMRQQTRVLRYVLLACDGFFDVFSPETADDLIRTLLTGEETNRNQTEPTLLKVCQLLFSGQSEVALSLVKRWKKGVQQVQNNIALLRLQRGLVDPVQAGDKRKRICEVLTYMAFICGSTDNVTVLLGVPLD